MSKRIIHIGLHKTGTTFLQRHYFPGIPNLTYHTSRDFYAKFGTEELSASLLISGEALSGMPWNDKWKRGIGNDHSYLGFFKKAVSNLKLIFPYAKIIIVFRKHGNLLISLYKQYIQEGGILPFKEFYNENGVIRDEDLNFSTQIRILNENFDQVDFLSFEQFKEEVVLYYDRYFTALGYGKSEGKVRHKANQSIAGKKVELLRKFNKVYPKLPTSFQNLLEKNQFTPRKILQGRMKFWKSKDSDHFKIIKDEINRKFKEDWAFFEEQQWKEPNH